ncbi:MAG: COX15/CtaA family protein [Chloroflexi bacterium]|nr:COX15/CtaA family protein [Chloroflexota bacterium]
MAQAPGTIITPSEQGEAERGTGSRTSLRSPSKDRLLLILLIASVILAFAQPTLGGVVRVTGSGDGCPDWPQCFGNWVPPWSDGHAIVEWSHRTVGTLFGAVILFSTAIIWIRYSQWRGLAYTYTAALLLVIAVGGVGGRVVLSDLDPAWRTLHLGGAEVVAALAVFGLVLATYRPAFPGMRSYLPEHGRGFKLGVAAASMSLVTLLSGAYAVWRGAGAVCPEWPLCGGPVIPSSELVWIHVIHRIISLVTAVLIFYAAHKIYRMPNTSPALKIAAIAAPVILTGQVLMGAANPWSQFDEWARAGHLSLATLLWVDLSFVVSLILLPVPRNEGAALTVSAGKTGSTGQAEAATEAGMD